MRAAFIVALLAGMAFVAGCQSSGPPPGPQRMTIYGQPCNYRSAEAGLCRTVYRNPG